ncbi:MAG: hypothetical protein IJU51_03730 [Clostridia bacterium]|nr:hypothetical protein [Clostridia bacterium]
MKQSQKIAYSGLITAFSAVMMIFSNFVPNVLFSFPALAGIVIYTLSFVSGSGYALISYAAVSIISLFLCGNKAVSVCFILFLGYYPILKKRLEKLKIKVISFIIKLLVFNAAAVSAYFIMLLVFSSPVFTKWVNESWVTVLLLIALNIIFLIYDLGLTLVFRKYEERIYNFVTKLLGKF